MKNFSKAISKSKIAGKCGKSRLHMIIAFLLVSFCWGLTPLHAANDITVKGTVKDAQTEELLIGVTVVVKGTGKGTVTDLNGQYSIKLSPEDKTLTFSMIGYVEQDIKLNGQQIIDVAMHQQTIEIDQVIVVGYGVQKKSDVTGAVASVSTERLSAPGNVTVAQAIQGAIPGITVMTSNSGADPSNTSILVRGRKSIGASNDPLVVVDGIPYAGSISDISPNDIQSLEVLKDASSAAIYGSRGSNGVILITTKIGSEGGVKINYDGYFSLDVVSKFPKLMQPEEYYNYMKLRQEAGYSNTLDPNEIYNYENGINSNWKDILLKNGTGQNHRLSISGGSQKTKFLVSVNYLDNRGVALNDKYNRISARLNLTTEIRSWLKYGTNTSFATINKDGTSVNLNQLLQTSPLARAYNDDGSINLSLYANDTKYRNPLEWTLYDSTDHTQQLVSNNYLQVDVPFVKGLSYRLNTGITYQWKDGSDYMPSYTIGGSDPGNVISYITNYKKQTWALEHIINYQRAFGKHNIFLTGLYSFESEENRTRYVQGSGFSNDYLGYYGMSAAQQLSVSFDKNKGTSDSYLISRMLRANYSFDSRYLLTLTVRQDGYSGFAANHKWGTFPSIALGWNIYNEKFFENASKVMNQLKLRFSYGVNGNQAVSPYQSMASISSQNGVDNKGGLLQGYLVSKLGNDYLGWENTKSFNIGIDYAFLDSRISGSVEYYNSKTSDLLLKRSISVVHGDDELLQNIGKTQNSGVEISVNSNNLTTKNFNWKTGLSVSFNKNKIVDLYGDNTDDINSKWFIGHPIDVNYGYNFLGVWQESEREEAAKYNALPGYAKYADVVKKDADGNPTTIIDADDKVIQGSKTPKVTVGMNNTLTYKDFSLSFFLYGSFGARKANYLMDSKYLLSREWWTPENATNKYWSMDVKATSYCGASQTDIFERTDFVRLKDITLSYSLPSKLLKTWKIDNLSVYVTGRNLFTITGYNGFDPELSDNQVIPVQRTFVFGLNFNF